MITRRWLFGAAAGVAAAPVIAALPKAPVGGKPYAGLAEALNLFTEETAVPNGLPTLSFRGINAELYNDPAFAKRYGLNRREG